MLSQHYLSKTLDQYINSTENTTCRLCLKSYDPIQLEYIFNSFENTTVAEYVTNFAKISITEEDYFSKVVCKFCLGKLNYIEDFRKKIYGFNEYLNQLYTVYVDLTEQAALYNPYSDNLSNSQPLHEPIREIDNEKDINEEVTVKEEKPNRIDDYQIVNDPNEEVKEIDITEHDLVKTELPTETENDGIDQELTVITRKKKRKRDPNLRFSCAQCDRVFKSKEGRDNHLKTHSLREYLECDLCQKKFLSKNNFKNHQKIHSEYGPTKIKCKVCEKDFKDVRSLENHMEIHSDVPKYQCDVCGKRLKHPASFKSHQQSHTFQLKEDTCPVCNKVIRSRFPISFKNHMKRHSINNQRLCPKCGKTFTSKDGFLAHLKSHAGTFDYKCDLCPKMYSTKKSLKNHTDSVHSTVKAYSCEICGKQFALQTGWYLHGRVHARKNPFTCTICEKKFGYPSHLKGHLRVVHGIREEASSDQ